MALGRPVKWIEERSESFTATTHGRDQVADLELAADDDGNITAMRGTVHASFGAYFTANAPGSLLGRLGPMLPQAYRLEHFDVELVGVFANTTPIGPYRGAGRPEAAYFTERLVDLLAREMNADPAELRRRNFIPPAAFPYTTVTGLTYESGDYHAGLDLLQEKLDADSAQRRRPAATGHLLGRGIATFVEPGGIVPRAPGPDGTIGDKATVTIGPDGKVTVAVGTSGHGQGHETAFAQLAADLLGVPYDDVTVVFGDTDTAPFGYGTFGSRSLAAGGTAIYHACQAALDAARRVDAPMPVAEAAARLGGISATGSSGAPPETYASGAYGCEVAVDPDTGAVTLLRVVAVDDCGVLVNPLLVEGQVHGAVAQGVGQALTEQVSYDENGQPMSASLMDYAVPFAATLPRIESYSVVTPSPLNPAWRQGHGRVGHDRRHPGPGQRRHGRPRAVRRPAPGHAADRGEGLDRHPREPRAPRPRGMTRPAAKHRARTEARALPGLRREGARYERTSDEEETGASGARRRAGAAQRAEQHSERGNKVDRQEQPGCSNGPLPLTSQRPIWIARRPRSPAQPG